MSAQPTIGNLAWAPLPAFDQVEVLDRFNGVPTLGVFGGPDDKILFWRVAGYVPQPNERSVWLYVPLEPEDEERLDSAGPDDLLNGLVFNSDVPRWATIGVAQDNRLVREFKWKLPRAAQPSDLTQLASRFAETASSAQDQHVKPSPPPLPPIVAENKHVEGVMQIWQIEELPEGVRLGMIKFALEMRSKGDEERRGA